MGRRARTAAALVLAVLLGLTASAVAVVLIQGGLRISVLSQIQPYKLPRAGTAPIAVFLSGHLSSSEGGIPPQLQRLQIEVNRHGLLQSQGLPVCDIPQIQPATTELALANCGPALIGSGQFWANIILPGQGPYPTQGRLLIFNGRSACASARHHRQAHHRLTSAAGPALRGQETISPLSGRLWPSRSRTQEGRRGERTFVVRDPKAPDRGRRDAPCQSRPELLAHIFTSHPFNTSFVISFSIRHISKGPFGTQLSASLPEALGTWGYLDRIKLTLRRKYRYHGHALSYFNAACPAPPQATRTAFPLAFVNFYFAHHPPLGASVTKTCGASG